MKQAVKKAESILIIEAIGFSFILLLSWGVAYFDAPRYIFGDPPTFNWQRAILRTAVILPIWAWVHFTTRRLLNRLRYLEGFLLVCAWCRKVGHDGEWLTMEEYFGSRFGQPTSHGICPECHDKVAAEVTTEATEKKE
jgi:hypothetical protein